MAPASSLFCQFVLVLASTFTRGGGRVEPASPTALTTSRTEALQARRSCASSLDNFTQSFLHRAWPKTRGPEIGSRSALIVVAHVFSWPPARLRHVQGGVGRRMFLISSPSGRLAACPNQRSLLCTSSAGMLVRQRRRRSSTDGTQSPRLTRRMRRMLSLSKTSFRLLLVLAMTRNRRAKSSALLPGRPCPLYVAIYHDATKNRNAVTSKIYPASDLFSALSVGGAHRADVFQFVKILQGLTVKHQG